MTTPKRSDEESRKAVGDDPDPFSSAFLTLHDGPAGTAGVGSDMAVGRWPPEIGEPSTPQSPLPPSPPAIFHSPVAAHDSTFPGRRRRTLTIDDSAKRTSVSPDARRSFTDLNNDGKKHIPASICETEYHSDDDGRYLALTETPARGLRFNSNLSACKTLLTPHTWTDADLIAHLRNVQFRKETEEALQDILRDWRGLTDVESLEELARKEEDQFGSATYQVYGVRRDTTAVQRHEGDGNDLVDALYAWDTLRRINPDGDAVGRITVLQEPSPVMLGGVHLTLGKHFDMNEIFQHLITDESNKGKTRAFVRNRAFEQDEIRRRSFFFVFKYYTVVGKDDDNNDLKPAPWQQFDERPSDKKSAHHIDIAECSSVLALSLGGPVVHRRKNLISRRRIVGKRDAGEEFDSFASWQLLSIQCFPDYEHSLRNEDSGRRHFYNGSYAFLDRLVDEYRDATKRNQILNERITALITPPTKFMFDGDLRDELLFEDHKFTYSRRYFWAFNSLGVINDGIRAMITAYQDNFNADFWDGRRQMLGWHLNLESEEARTYYKELKTLRVELEQAIEDLRAVLRKNEDTKRDIISLRDQLFSGSSILESRRAIEQGDNIKVLTSISMIFLPLTFVTSVFGIENFPIPGDSWQFAVTMVTVCVPFILFVLLLQTRTGMKLFKDSFNLIDKWFHRLSNRSKDVMHIHHHGGKAGEHAGPPPQDPKRRHRTFSRPFNSKPPAAGKAVAESPVRKEVESRRVVQPSRSPKWRQRWWKAGTGDAGVKIANGDTV